MSEKGLVRFIAPWDVYRGRAEQVKGWHVVIWFFLEVFIFWCSFPLSSRWMFLVLVRTIMVTGITTGKTTATLVNSAKPGCTTQTLRRCWSTPWPVKGKSKCIAVHEAPSGPHTHTTTSPHDWQDTRGGTPLRNLSPTRIAASCHFVTVAPRGFAVCGCYATVYDFLSWMPNSGSPADVLVSSEALVCSCHYSVFTIFFKLEDYLHLFQTNPVHWCWRRANASQPLGLIFIKLNVMHVLQIS